MSNNIIQDKNKIKKEKYYFNYVLTNKLNNIFSIYKENIFNKIN